ncbi:MAG TPA: 1,6-anhydro-N-acetylmuramyl-L-alanine amidase AmpD [Methylobacter sp.]|jgi:AmpD protein
MRIDRHRLTDITQTPSPNFDERPDPADISLLVIHCISLPPGKFGDHYIDRLFCNQLDPDEHPYFKDVYQLTVSAHLLIKRDGSCVQYVPFDKRAWHAGKSTYEGRERCNDFSIGIELEGTEFVDYTDQQYVQLAAVTRILLEAYPKLSAQRITGHSDIAPGRKTDPGASFDWQRLLELLK